MIRAVEPEGPLIEAGAYRLSPTASADRAGVIAAGQSPRIGGKLPWFPQPFPDHYADGWIEESERRWREGLNWVLSILDADGAYVGSVAFIPLPDEVMEIAYWVLPAHEGCGTATLAAGAALAWARTALKPAWFFAKTGPDNLASQRVLQKLGFRATGDALRPTFELDG